MSRANLIRKMFVRPIIERSTLTVEETSLAKKTLLIDQRIFSNAAIKRLLHEYDEILDDKSDEIFSNKKDPNVLTLIILDFIDFLSLYFVFTLNTGSHFKYMEVVNALHALLDIGIHEEKRQQWWFLLLRLHLDIGLWAKNSTNSQYHTLLPNCVKAYDAILDLMKDKAQLQLLLLNTLWSEGQFKFQLKMDYVRILDEWITYSFLNDTRNTMKLITLELNFILDNDLLQIFATLWFFRAIDLAEKYQERQFFRQAEYLVRVAKFVAAKFTDSEKDVEMMLTRTKIFDAKQCLYLIMFDEKLQEENTSCLEFKQINSVKASLDWNVNVPKNGIEFIRKYQQAEACVEVLKQELSWDVEVQVLLNAWNSYSRKVLPIF